MDRTGASDGGISWSNYYVTCMIRSAQASAGVSYRTERPVSMVALNGAEVCSFVRLLTATSGSVRRTNWKC